uniref:Uncharacterized protein LOC117309754 isoform X3 n=1 Tax=Tursiops truncatus TaxID=9739 RepID=A0A6J3QPK3_TURTR|nr:uncharacterized protein LOC117309754 isoform X3 [Tursiops truncatus]
MVELVRFVVPVAGDKTLLVWELSSGPTAEALQHSVFSLLPVWPSVFGPSLPKRSSGRSWVLWHHQVLFSKGCPQSPKGMRPEAAFPDISSEGGHKPPSCCDKVREWHGHIYATFSNNCKVCSPPATQLVLISWSATLLVSLVAKGRKNVSQTSALRKKSSDCQNWISTFEFPRMLRPVVSLGSSASFPTSLHPWAAGVWGHLGLQPKSRLIVCGQGGQGGVGKRARQEVRVAFARGRMAWALGTLGKRPTLVARIGSPH